MTRIEEMEARIEEVSGWYGQPPEAEKVVKNAKWLLEMVRRMKPLIEYLCKWETCAFGEGDDCPVCQANSLLAELKEGK